MSEKGEINITESTSTVIWKIENFCKCGIKLSGKVFSPSFFIHGIKGNIDMYKTKMPESKTEYLTMYLKLQVLSKINVSFALSILTKANKVLYLRKSTPRTEFTIEQNSWGFDKFLRSTSPVLANNQLTIQCKISIDQNKIEDKQNLTAKTRLTESFNFEKFLFSESLSDIQLIVGEEVFYAHKFILAARSEVFAAMFTHEMKESMENKVKIEDIDCKVLKEMLRYIYTQKVDTIDKTITEGLLVAADKYLLNELKSICENNLIESLSYDNFVESLVTADKYNLNDLKKDAVQFIASHSDDIIEEINMPLD